MATTYTLIASVTVGSGGAADIEFTSIPATYTDLVVHCSLRGDDATRDKTWVNIQFNNTTANRTWRNIYNTGSESDTTNRLTGTSSANSTANTFGSGFLYILNYTSSNNKSISGDSAAESNGALTNSMGLDANLWSNSAAITSIKLIPGDGTAWLEHSTAYLYGISNA
jgi:hypothetical protein